MIYLDNAATTLHKPSAMIEGMMAALASLGNAGRGATPESLEASHIIFDAREAINELVNGASPSQVAFTSNATEALNIAIKGIFQSGDHVITSVMEHNSVLRPLFELEQQGVELTILDVNEQGYVTAEEVQAAIKPTTRGVVLTHASNLTGVANPIASIAQVTRANNLTFIVDASQTLGAVPIDVQGMEIDVLCFTGHKALMGPQGTGGLYVRPDVHIRPLKTGGTGVQTYSREHPETMPMALEAGTLNGHGLAGLAASAQYILDYGIDKIAQEERALTDYFYTAMQQIEGVTLYGTFEADRPHSPIVPINIRNLNSSEVANLLDENYGITVRSGGHCAPLMHEALGTVEQGIVRFSFAHSTTIADLDAAIAAVQAIAADCD